MVLQEPGKMTRPISKLKICHAEFSFSLQNHPTTKKIIVHLFFLGHNTKLGPLGAVSTETWNFF